MGKRDKVVDLANVSRPVSPKVAEQLSDPIELLRLLQDAILNKAYDKSEVSDALRTVLSKFEAKNRTFLIAAAHAEIPRVLRLMSFLTQCEEAMVDEEMKLIENASLKDMTKLYALAQGTLVTSLDNIKRVADMRIDAMKAGVTMDDLFSSDSEANALADLPGLDSGKRERVRKLIEGLAESVADDDSVEEDDSPDDDTDD